MLGRRRSLLCTLGDNEAAISVMVAELIDRNGDLGIDRSTQTAETTAYFVSDFLLWLEPLF